MPLDSDGMKDIQDFLAQLINIPSITGEEEKVSLFLKDFLSDQGMSVTLMPVAGNRYNVYATFSEKPFVILTTHMDTVAPFIRARLSEGVLYGRGACDAKGIMASMIYAIAGLEKELQEKAGLLFVVGEEVDSIGAKTAAQGGLSPRYFINGEPTGNTLVHAQKGTSLFEVKATGKAAHSGYPEYGSSAIDTLLQYLDRLKTYNWPENNILGKTLINIGKIKGGEAINTLASTAQAECCIRVVTTAREINDVLHNLLIDGVEIKILSELISRMNISKMKM